MLTSISMQAANLRWASSQQIYYKKALQVSISYMYHL